MMSSSVPLKKICLVPILLLILAGLVIPSDGSHGFFNLKSLSFILSFLSMAFLFFIKNEATVSDAKLVIFLLFFSIWLFLGCLFSLVNHETETTLMFDQFKVFVITVFTFLILAFAVNNKFLSYTTFFNAIVGFNIFYSLIKIFLVVFFLLGLINLSDLLQSLGIQYMSMEILGDLSRLQTSVDIITPFLLLFVFNSNFLGINYSKKFKIFYLVVSVLSIILSFSRYLLFIGFISFSLYLFCLSMKNMLKIFPFFLLSIISVVFIIGPETIYLVIEKRFLSSSAESSDMMRTLQINALLEDFSKYQFFGKGMGSHASTYIRSETTLHSYEVQWIAFLMQFGVFGIVFLLLNLSLIISKYIVFPMSRARVSFIILFILWLLSGFTNPFLISLLSGIIYALFYLSADQLAFETRYDLGTAGT